MNLERAIESLAAEVRRSNALLVEVRDALLAQQERGRAPDALVDERYARVLVCLADWMGAMDFPFTAAEVLDAAQSYHALDEALAAAGLTTTGKLGAAFRAMRDRDFDGLRLRRDGEGWCLDRHRTST